MIIQNILPTNYYLHKTKLQQDGTCQLCGNYLKTKLHLLSDCIKVNNLWKYFHYCIKTSTGTDLHWYRIYKTGLFWWLNFILFVVWKYIYIFFHPEKSCFCRHQWFSANLQKEMESMGKFISTVLNMIFFVSYPLISLTHR